MLRLAAIASTLVASSAAFAADLPSRKGVPLAPPSAACLERAALPTDVFGFNTGSDVNDAGALSAAATYNGAYGTRFGSFAGHTGTFQIAYGFGPCFEIGPYVLGASLRNGQALGLGDGSAFGGGVEAKWKFLGRDTHGVGMTADLILQGQGVSGAFFTPTRRVYDAIASLFIDKELAAGKFYGAINVSYDFNFRDRVVVGDFKNTSVLRLGAALAYQVVDGFFIGADVNHYRRYSNSFFGGELGYATFAGPNFFWQATPKLAVTAAYNIQLAGKTTGFGGVPGDIDLVNFNQHLLKVKLAYSF
jgi:hypothetical protein